MNSNSTTVIPLHMCCIKKIQYVCTCLSRECQKRVNVNNELTFNSTCRNNRLYFKENSHWQSLSFPLQTKHLFSRFEFTYFVQTTFM